jgi:polyhydroxyalkanoate synthesis regulator phasin
MNSNNLLDLLQTGLRISLGATTSLVETLQDPQKREESVSQLQSDLSQKVTEWAEKGAVTEQEARQFIEQMWRQQSYPGHSPTTETPSDGSDVPPTTVTSPSTQMEIQELTAQIAALRTELEKLRNTRSDN